jgi:hypothetical protein
MILSRTRKYQRHLSDQQGGGLTISLQCEAREREKMRNCLKTSIERPELILCKSREEIRKNMAISWCEISNSFSAIGCGYELVFSLTKSLLPSSRWGQPKSANNNFLTKNDLSRVCTFDIRSIRSLPVLVVRFTSNRPALSLSHNPTVNEGLGIGNEELETRKQ